MRSTSAQQVASHVVGMVSLTFVHRSVHEGASTQCGKSVAKGFIPRNLSRRVGASARKASKVELKRWCARAQSSAAAPWTAPTAKRNDNKNTRVNMANVKKKRLFFKDLSLNISAPRTPLLRTGQQTQARDTPFETPLNEDRRTGKEQVFLVVSSSMTTTQVRLIMKI